MSSQKLNGIVAACHSPLSFSLKRCHIFNPIGLTRSNSQLVPPTPPPMPKMSSVSSSKREKNTHDNQGVILIWSQYREYSNLTFSFRVYVHLSLTSYLLILVSFQPLKKTTLPGSPFFPLTMRSWCTVAGKTTSSGMTRRWITCSPHLFSHSIPTMRISF